MAVKYDCTVCKKQVTATKNMRYRTHTTGDGDPCGNSSVEIPEHILAQPVGADDRPDVPREGVDFAKCGECGRSVKLTRLGYFEHHVTTLRGDVRCEMSGVRYRREETVESRLLTEPGTTNSPKVRDSSTPVANRSATSAGATGVAPGGASGVPVPESAAPAAPASPPSSMSMEEPGKSNLERQPMEPSPASTDTSKISTTPSASGPRKPSATPSGAGGETAGSASAGGAPPVLHLAPLLGDGTVLQPFSHVCQPFPAPAKVSLEQAMSPEGKDRATRFREIFFSYGNRRTDDNRSAQTTLGPSEIGHECDRRLAMSLMGVEPVNPGGDGWAAWVGTQGHKGLDEVFTWASGNTGRFLTETRVHLDSKYVPYGTADLFDRILHEVGDFKFMGDYSLKKLIAEGPPEHYQVQLHVYGLGMERLGEKVDGVALYGLPRAGSSLDGMYVWQAPYDRKRALDALARVDRIAGEADRLYGGAEHSRMDAAAEFDVASKEECRYCPFSLKGDKAMRKGCPGA